MNMNRFKMNPQRREDVKKLMEFFSKKRDGEIVDWTSVEIGTGIRMDLSGKGLARHAVKRIGKRWLSLPGRGLEMASAENGVEVVTHATRKIASALNVAVATTKVIATFVPEMNEEKKQRFLLQQATLSALDLSSSLVKRVK